LNIEQIIFEWFSTCVLFLVCRLWLSRKERRAQLLRDNVTTFTAEETRAMANPHAHHAMASAAVVAIVQKSLVPTIPALQFFDMTDTNDADVHDIGASSFSARVTTPRHALPTVRRRQSHVQSPRPDLFSSPASWESSSVETFASSSIMEDKNIMMGTCPLSRDTTSFTPTPPPLPQHRPMTSMPSIALDPHPHHSHHSHPPHSHQQHETPRGICYTMGTQGQRQTKVQHSVGDIWKYYQLSTTSRYESASYRFMDRSMDRSMYLSMSSIHIVAQAMEVYRERKQHALTDRRGGSCPDTLHSYACIDGRCRPHFVV
jgi:hypothetical protein